MRKLLPLLLLVVAFMATPLSAQSGLETVRLETSSLQGGIPGYLRVHAPYPGGSVVIGFGAATWSPMPAPGPVVLVAPVYQVRGTVDSSGVFEVQVPLPNPAWPGRVFFGQAFVLNPQGFWQGSDRIARVGEASQTAPWADGTASLPFTASMKGSADVESLDFDRDGDLDLVVVSEASIFGPGGIQLLANDGSGSYADESSQRLAPGADRAAFVVRTGDLDLDGHLDLVVAGSQDAAGNPLPATLLLNDGTGSFNAGQDLSSALAGTTSVALGDLDGDGDLDVVLSDGYQHSPTGGIQSLALFLNQGGLQGGTLGVFVEDSLFATSPFNNDDATTSTVHFADVDRDADLDLFVTRTSLGGGGTNMLLINDGLGSFSDESPSRLPVLQNGLGDMSSDARFLDANGDGYLDLLVANSHLSVIPADSGDYLRNLGATNPGVFVDDPVAFPDFFDERLAIRLGVETGDVDLDGDADVIILPHEFFGSTLPFVGNPVLYLNQGGAQGGNTGTFLEDTAFWALGSMVTSITYQGELFDADGDGDLDFYAASYAGIVDPSKTQDHLSFNELR